MRRPEFPPPPPNYSRHLCPNCHTMIKLKKGGRTCGCEAVAKSQGLAPDSNDKVLYLVNEAQRPIGTIDYIRGLESHINVGTDPAISNAISLIQTEF